MGDAAIPPVCSALASHRCCAFVAATSSPGIGAVSRPPAGSLHRIPRASRSPSCPAVPLITRACSLRGRGVGSLLQPRLAQVFVLLNLEPLSRPGSTVAALHTLLHREQVGYTISSSCPSQRPLDRASLATTRRVLAMTSSTRRRWASRLLPKRSRAARSRSSVRCTTGTCRYVCWSWCPNHQD